MCRAIGDWEIKLSHRNDLLEIMEDRHGLRSTLIPSQLPITPWHNAIGDATLADAILYRLLHNCQKLALRGESMRKMPSEIPESDHQEGLTRAILAPGTTSRPRCAVAPKFAPGKFVELRGLMGRDAQMPRRQGWRGAASPSLTDRP